MPPAPLNFITPPQVLDQEAGTTLYAAVYAGGARSLVSAPAGGLATTTGTYKSWECTPDAGNGTYRAIVELVDTAADGTSERLGWAGGWVLGWVPCSGRQARGWLLGWVLGGAAALVQGHLSAGTAHRR